MKCTESERKGVIIFTLEGDINLFDAPTLRTTFMNKLSKGRKVIIEMQGVEYIDSSGHRRYSLCGYRGKKARC